MTIAALQAWVRDVARLTRPDDVCWCDGSQEESERLNEQMVAGGQFVRLDPRRFPNSFYARSDPSDVARVEDRTFICSRDPDDAGPTNNWRDPGEMHDRLRGLLRGAMRGRTLYVVPYLMGPPGSPAARVGVELTDSPYVVASLRIMTRMGRVALEALGENGRFSRGLHCKGSLDPGERYISHFPEEDLAVSVNSDYGGNALLSKKCFALRLASVAARSEGWLAEHMMVVGVTDPQGRKTWIAGAFPSACGKTNLAMLVPPPADRCAGWRVETLGDDIAWLRFGPDGRLWAINPEAGFFGVAPGTSEATNPNALAACRANSVFTNVALLPDNSVWWEGMGPPPDAALDWRGRPWDPKSPEPAAHPNSRFTAPAAQCPSLAREWADPRGVPIDAIVFGGRRAKATPLVYQAFDWQHGTYVGATMSSEKTAAATGRVGELRHDPMAMLPFCGYHMADYWRHWLALGRTAGARMPAVFHVNWFRTDDRGRYLWPGYSENLRVLKWIVARTRGDADAVETPLGYVPGTHGLNLTGLRLSPSELGLLMSIDRDEWRREVEQRAGWLQRFGEKVPSAMWTENEHLRRRLRVAV